MDTKLGNSLMRLVDSLRTLRFDSEQILDLVTGKAAARTALATVRGAVDSLRKLGYPDAYIVTVLAGGSPGVSEPSEPSPSTAEAKLARPRKAPKAPSTGRRQSAPKRANATRSRAPKRPPSSVTNRELGTYRRETGNPSATAEEVARAKADKSNPWSLKAALKRLSSSGPPRDHKD